MHRVPYPIGTPARIIGFAPGPITFVLTRTTAWDGDSLVISITTLQGESKDSKPYTTTARLTVSGDHLTIEGVRASRDGTQTKYSATYAKKVSHLQAAEPCSPPSGAMSNRKVGKCKRRPAKKA